MEDNTIFDSLRRIYATEIVDDFIAAYIETKNSAPAEPFENLMIEIASDILDLKSKCKKGANLFLVSLALITCDSGDNDPETEALSNKHIKAATIYILLNESKYADNH